VLLIDIAFLQDPGHLAWELRGVRPGAATITVAGWDRVWELVVDP
jgi:hypothetical protein